MGFKFYFHDIVILVSGIDSINLKNIIYTSTYTVFDKDFEMNKLFCVGFL